MTVEAVLRVALEVSVLLVLVYGITTSELGRTLRVGFMRWVWMYTLLICPYCTGWWVAVYVAYALGGNILLTPLYYMAVPITLHVLPNFITGPRPTELDTFVKLHRRNHL